MVIEAGTHLTLVEGMVDRDTGALPVVQKNCVATMQINIQEEARYFVDLKMAKKLNNEHWPFNGSLPCQFYQYLENRGLVIPSKEPVEVNLTEILNNALDGQIEVES